MFSMGTRSADIDGQWIWSSALFLFQLIVSFHVYLGWLSSCSFHNVKWWANCCQERTLVNITDEFCISILFKRDDATEAFTNIDFGWMRLTVCTSFFLPGKLIVCRSFDEWLSGRRRLLAFNLIALPIWNNWFDGFDKSSHRSLVDLVSDCNECLLFSQRDNLWILFSTRCTFDLNRWNFLTVSIDYVLSSCYT